MQNNLQSHKVYQKQTLKDETIASAKHNKVYFSSEYIRVNKNEIDYSSLSPEIKHVFSKSLQMCDDSRIIKRVFYRWHESQLKICPQKIMLSNEEGARLIWKMQKAIEQKTVAEKLSSLKKEIQSLKAEYQSHKLSYKQIQAKEAILQNLQPGQKLSYKYVTLLQKMNQYKSWMENRLQVLIAEIQQKQQELKKFEKRQQFTTYFYSKLEYSLTKIITKQVRSLLRESIIGILQISNQIVEQGQIDKQQVYVVFEQAYKTIKIGKSTIICYVGSDFYLQKVDEFNKIILQRMSMNQRQLKETNIASCHHCMKVCSIKKLKFCKILIGQKQLKPYPSTDYFSYRKIYFQGDYFYQPAQSHILSFHIYNKNAEKKLTCNRGYCQECISQFYSDEEFKCAYCEGVCACSRCQKAADLVRLMALNFQNDPKQRKKYHQILKLFGEKGHKDVSEFLQLRLPQDLSQYKLLKQTYLNFTQPLSYNVVFPNVVTVSNQDLPGLLVKKNKEEKLVSKEIKEAFETKKKNESRHSNQVPCLKNQEKYLNELLQPALYSIFFNPQSKNTEEQVAKTSKLC